MYEMQENAEKITAPFKNKNLVAYKNTVIDDGYI